MTREQQPVLIVIDDEPGILDVVGRSASRAGFHVVACGSGREGIARAQSARADLVMVDLRMPEVGGLEVLGALRRVNPNCQAVLTAGRAPAQIAVEAVKMGALDYLVKPLDPGRLEQTFMAVRDEIDRRRSVLSMERDLAARLEFCGMVGRAPQMQDLFALIRRLAAHARTALVTGERGTGKELAARALHQIGPHGGGRFVTANCATDAIAALVEAADGGTLFLDEVGELPLSEQGGLLRVLELGEVHRAGSQESRQVNVHVVAASSRDLRAAVAAGGFRRDLYDRLCGVELALPALRHRREDIPYLTAAFVRDGAERLGKPLEGLTAGAERLVAAAAWEGNVRELRNAIERACIVASGPFITERELMVNVPSPAPGAPSSSGARRTSAAAAAGNTESLASVEREHIQRALAKAGGNKKAAAQMLGLSRRALYRRLERLDLADSISRRREPELAGISE